MSRRRTMRRALVAGLVSVSVLVPGAAAAAGTQTVPDHVCDHEWQRGTRQVKRLIWCAAHHWDSPGWPKKAIEVARCESNLNPRAYNAGGYAGLFQQATRYWGTRAERWGLGQRSVFNARANIIVSVRMARAAGSWSAWGGCA